MLAAAGIGSLACIGTSQGMLDALLEEGSSSTGSNVSWLGSVLPGWSLEQSESLYALSVQRIRSISSDAQSADVKRSDRDTLLYVKDVLSLTGKQLADAMAVSRGGLYKWLDEKAAMRDLSRERLDKLRSLADQWSAVAGMSISRSSWISRSEQALFVKELTGNKDGEYADARSRLDQLAALKPLVKSSHRSVLDIAKEKNWKKLPAHIRVAERSSRIPSARTNTD